MALLHISENLADLNWRRNQSKGFGTKELGENARQAAYAFKGEVYLGLDTYSIPLEKLDALQDKLRILSGLYGLLKPLDVIQPYRLEMGIGLPVGESKNLYAFWRETITKALKRELKKGEPLVNLASQEYFSAIDCKALKAPVVTPEFRDFRDGRLTTITFFAKKARGLMVRHIIDTGAETLDDIRAFDGDGYRFDANLSKGGTLVFTR
jgi:cytoplasmic iron level regulating protein YaaA (DUF328/UPF0246 family)